MRHTSTLLILCLATTAMAGNITRQQARKAAMDFAAKRAVELQSEPRRAPGTTAADPDAQPIYIFNTAADEGFILVAGDDRVEPIIGYTTSGSYDPDALPDNFRAWLRTVQQEISTLMATPSAANKASAQMQLHTAIAPLIQTHWSQGDDTQEGYIYNTLTPTISGRHTLTGCVATAGAQIMYYHRHPKTATKSVPAYVSNKTVGTLSSLPPITFNWDAMKTEYTSDDQGTEAETAVSQLMLYCGYAAQMNYGLGSSGANEGVLAQAMTELFDYDPYTWRSISRSDYGVAEWDNIIYGELAARRPVIYSGSAWYGGGHAFLIDGYDGKGFYHVNWGWGGYQDGYFRLHVTNPDFKDGLESGYVLDVSAVIGIQPNTGIVPTETGDANDTWENLTTDEHVAKVFQSSVEGTVIKLGIGNPYEEAQGFGYGLAEKNADNTLTLVEGLDYFTNWPLNSRRYYLIDFNVSEYSLPDGTHTLVPVSMQTGDPTWRQCTPLETGFRVTVDGSNITIQAMPVVDLRVSDLTCLGSHQVGTRHSVNMTLTNAGDNYDTYLYLFVSKTDEPDTYQDWNRLKAKAGSVKHRTMSFDDSGPGTYNVWIATDQNCNNVLAQTTVTIGQMLQATAFDFPGNCLATAFQPVVATVSSPVGDCTEPLYLFVSTSPGSLGAATYCTATAIPAGSTEDVTFLFYPEQAGTYYLTIATDEDGKNVIGSTSVQIITPPTGEVTLAVQDNACKTTAKTATLTLTVANTGSVTYYQGFRARLWTRTIDGRYIYYSLKDSYTTEDVTLQPGQTVTVVAPFENLETGQSYRVEWYYRPTFGGDFTEIPNTRQVIEPKAVSGDVNGDGSVTPSDAIMILYHYFNVAQNGFNADVADLNNDGTVSPADAIEALYIYFGTGQNKAPKRGEQTNEPE